VQHRFTDEEHFLKNNEVKVKEGIVLPFTAGRTGFSKGQW